MSARPLRARIRTRAAASRSLAVLLLGATLALGLPSSARAQKAPEPATPGAAPAGLLSERDFLAEIPRVFSASRLPQTPADSPGAVTVIDRDMIRALGARDVADLFRLVPGFVVGQASGGRSVVAYHGLSGQISQRMQVLMDGRSLYAPYLFGGIDWNALPISLDDIDRIEVFRGSNSATYGANAFLGVANIVTRAAAQTQGGHGALRLGDSGIRDISARYGAAGRGFAWRLSAGEQADDGLRGVFDDRRARYLGLRGEVQLNARDELNFEAGINRTRLGIGRLHSTGDPERFEQTSTSYAQTRLKRVVSDDQEFSLSASYTIDRGDDRYGITVTPTDTLAIDYGRKAQRQHLEYQHWLGLGEGLRAAWGIELRRNTVTAPQLFSSNAAQRSSSARAYLNTEWTPSQRWTFNLGGLVENESLSGTHLAPRIAVNWKPSPGQTLRAGYSEAFRTPSLFEQRSDWRFVYNGQTIDIRYLSRGGLLPERVRAFELSWLGEFRELGLSVDARLFDERISRLITQQLYALPPGSEYDPDSGAYDLRNADSARIQGVEYQIQWRPTRAQHWIAGHYLARRSGSNDFVVDSIPAYGAYVLGSLRLDAQHSASMFYQVSAPIRWIGERSTVPSRRRLDLRLERRFTLDGVRGTVALIGQAIVGGSSPDFRDNQFFDRRGWLSLELAY